MDVQGVQEVIYLADACPMQPSEIQIEMSFCSATAQIQTIGTKREADSDTVLNRPAADASRWGVSGACRPALVARKWGRVSQSSMQTGKKGRSICNRGPLLRYVAHTNAPPKLSVSQRPEHESYGRDRQIRRRATANVNPAYGAC